MLDVRSWLSAVAWAVAFAVPCSAWAQVAPTRPAAADTPSAPDESGAKSAAHHTKEVAASALSDLDQQLLLSLHRSHQGNIIVSDFTKTRTDSPAVRRYGEHLAQDHRQLDDAMLALAKRRGVQLATLAPSEQEIARSKRERSMMNRLSTLRGSAFDREFLAAMIASQREAISQVEHARAELNDPQLRAQLDKLLTTLNQHVSAAQTLSSNKP